MRRQRQRPRGWCAHRFAAFWLMPIQLGDGAPGASSETASTVNSVRRRAVLAGTDSRHGICAALGISHTAMSATLRALQSALPGGTRQACPTFIGPNCVVAEGSGRTHLRAKEGRRRQAADARGRRAVGVHGRAVEPHAHDEAARPALHHRAHQGRREGQPPSLAQANARRRSGAPALEAGPRGERLHKRQNAGLLRCRRRQVRRQHLDAERRQHRERGWRLQASGSSASVRDQAAKQPRARQRALCAPAAAAPAGLMLAARLLRAPTRLSLAKFRALATWCRLPDSHGALARANTS